MLLSNDRSTSPNLYANNKLKNSSLSSSVSSSSSSSTSSSSFRPTKMSPYTSSSASSHQFTLKAQNSSNLSDRYLTNHFNSKPCNQRQPSSFSYQTYNPNRISSYDNENLYENSTGNFWPKHEKISEDASTKSDSVKTFCRKRASIAACTDAPKPSLLNKALNYASKATGSNSSLHKNSTFSWRAKLGKYLATSKTKKPQQDGCDIALDDDDIYSSYHLTRKNPIHLQSPDNLKNSNLNILISSSSSSSASSQPSPSPIKDKKPNLTNSLQKLTITNGFNSLRKMLKLKSSSKQNLDTFESQTLNRQCKKGSKQIKKQLSFSQPKTDSKFKIYKSMFKPNKDEFESTRNDSSCLKLNATNFKSCVHNDSSGSTLFNNILSSSPITVKNFDQPEVDQVAISSPNVKMYDGYRSIIKQIEELKLGPKEDEEELSEEDLKCDLEVASFFTKTIKCQAVNNYFSTNDLMNYDYSQTCQFEPEDEDDSQNLDLLVKQLVAEASLSNFTFEQKMNSTEENYENLDFDEKNSFDLSEYVDDCGDSSPQSVDSESMPECVENSYENELNYMRVPRYYQNSNSLGHVAKVQPVESRTLKSNLFYPEKSQSNSNNDSIKIEKRIRLNYRRAQNGAGGYASNANYLNFGTLC